MNSLWHLYTSVTKSVIRIISAMWAVQVNDWTVLALGFGVAEVLGVLEELKDYR